MINIILILYKTLEKSNSNKTHQTGEETTRGHGKTHNYCTSRESRCLVILVLRKMGFCTLGVKKSVETFAVSAFRFSSNDKRLPLETLGKRKYVHHDVHILLYRSELPLSNDDTREPRKIGTMPLVLQKSQLSILFSDPFSRLLRFRFVQCILRITLSIMSSAEKSCPRGRIII